MQREKEVWSQHREGERSLVPECRERRKFGLSTEREKFGARMHTERSLVPVCREREKSLVPAQRKRSLVPVSAERTNLEHTLHTSISRQQSMRRKKRCWLNAVDTTVTIKQRCKYATSVDIQKRALKN